MNKCEVFYDSLTHQIIWISKEDEVVKAFEEMNKVIKKTEVKPFKYKHASFEEFKKAMGNKEIFTLE